MLFLCGAVPALARRAERARAWCTTHLTQHLCHTRSIRAVGAAGLPFALRWYDRIELSAERRVQKPLRLWSYVQRMCNVEALASFLPDPPSAVNLCIQEDSTHV
jgi:hypothetical protein